MKLGAFLDFLFPPRISERLVRTEARTIASLIHPQLIDETQVTALLPYRHESVKAFILEAKYHGNKEAQKVLGAVLADYLREYLVDEGTLVTRPYALVPIPLSRKRRRQRGYNQVEEVCKVAARELGDLITLMPQALTRTRDTAPQTTLTHADRKQNVRGAIMAPRTLSASYTYVVVDDVITTGATMHEALTALAGGGATHLTPLALSYSGVA